MNAMTQRLLATLRARGLAIGGPKPGQPDDTLNLIGPDKERTPEVMNALKLCKPQLIELYGRNAQASPDVGTEPHGDILVGAPPAGERFPQR